MNSHFGNSASLGIATDHLRLYRPDLRVGVVDWWSIDAEVAREMRRSKATTCTRTARKRR